MNIFSNLFGVFKQRGLVSMFKEGRSLFGFLVAGLIASILGALLYGFAMGIGLGVETAVKDTVKFGLIVFLTFILVLPIFLLSYRFLGRMSVRAGSRPFR